jgi:hypothetical protein
MRTNLRIFSLIASAALIGCGPGSGPGSKLLPDVHHGGVIVPLTDNQAYVELLNGERKKKGSTYETTIVAYLLAPDLKTSLADAPTSVQVKIGTPKGDQVVKLERSPDSADPVGGSRFISEFGPFDLVQTGGEVTVEVSGKTLSGPFRGPR